MQVNPIKFACITLLLAVLAGGLVGYFLAGSSSVDVKRGREMRVAKIRAKAEKAKRTEIAIRESQIHDPGARVDDVAAADAVDSDSVAQTNLDAVIAEVVKFMEDEVKESDLTLAQVRKLSALQNAIARKDIGVARRILSGISAMGNSRLSRAARSLAGQLASLDRAGFGGGLDFGGAGGVVDVAGGGHGAGGGGDGAGAGDGAGDAVADAGGEVVADGEEEVMTMEQFEKMVKEQDAYREWQSTIDKSADDAARIANIRSGLAEFTDTGLQKSLVRNLTYVQDKALAAQAAVEIIVSGNEAQGEEARDAYHWATGEKYVDPETAQKVIEALPKKD